MTQTINEEAIRRIADLEEGVSVTAGMLDTAAFYRLIERQHAISNPTEKAFSGVLGLFLNRARREHSLSLEQLGEEIDPSVPLAAFSHSSSLVSRMFLPDFSANQAQTGCRLR